MSGTDDRVPPPGFGDDGESMSPEERAQFDAMFWAESFPTESEWLTLPLPAEFADGFAAELRGGDEPHADDGPTRSDEGASDFVRRTLAALRDERALDGELQRLDAALPKATLDAFAAPAPSSNFVPRVVAAIADERRHRWQRLLARYVAPEPSAQFVSRTLRALQAAEAEHGPTRAPTLAGPGSTRQPLAVRDAATRGAASVPAPAGRRATFGPLLGVLLAAAASLLGWLVLTGPEPRAPLELRVARSAPVGSAHGYAASPLPEILFVADLRRDPAALADDSADGLWLTGIELAAEREPLGPGYLEQGR